MASTGRMIAEDGSVVNIADILGGYNTGKKVNIEQYAPHSGEFINESGEIINIAKMIGKGGAGSTISVTAKKEGGKTTLTINTDGNIQTVEILDGADGQPGADGQHGADGQPGADGYTPIRGTDYWTNADIEEIHAYIDEKILGGEW